MTTIQSSHSSTVRKATDGDVHTIAGSLASAFAEDPLLLWLLGGARDAERRLKPVFTGIARLNLARREHYVFVGGNGDAVAVWRGIDQWKYSTGQLLRAMPSNIRSFRWRTPRLLRVLSVVEKVHPEEPHYYLVVLGTRADRQSNGLGSAAINAMLDRCDEEGVPAYLESSNPRNEPFYARHGFVRRGEIPLPSNCPPIVPMWRDPR